MFLYFGDLYTKANTKHVSLDTLAADDDVVALEGLRELTVRRDQSVGRECLKLDSADVEYHANRQALCVFSSRAYMCSAGRCWCRPANHLWLSPPPRF